MRSKAPPGAHQAGLFAAPIDLVVDTYSL